MNPQQPFDPNQPSNQYVPPRSGYYQQPYGQAPYGGGPGRLPSANGSLILTLGIISIFCAGIILGPIVWIMGNSALTSIDSGLADPYERGSVSAGRTCGIVSTVLHGLGLLLYGLFFFIVVVAAATQSHQ